MYSAKVVYVTKFIITVLVDIRLSTRYKYMYFLEATFIF